jgi:ABC-type nitrate/sulfonate/bicarbonate transport system substrate-binding protein
MRGEKYLPIRAMLLGSVLLAILLASNSCNNTIAEKPVVRIGVQRTALYRHIFLATERRLFEKNGLTAELVPFDSANSLMASLLAGAIDVAGLTNLQVAVSARREAGADLRFLNFQVWTKDAFPDYIVVRADSPAKTIADLAGARVGIHPGSAVRAFATAVFRTSSKHGVSIGQMIEIDPKLAVTALQARSVDALYCFDPVCTVAVEKGVGRILVENPLRLVFEPPIPISGTAVTGHYAASHPERVAAIIRALDESIIMLRDPATAHDAIEAIAANTGVDRDLITRMRPSEYWTEREIDAGRVNNFINALREIGAIGGLVPVDDFLLTGARVRRGGDDAVNR